MTMTKATPEIHCVDVWPNGLGKDKLRAYKAMIDAGQITKRTCIINRATGRIMVDYYSTVPHEWIRQEMARIAGEARA